MASFYRRATSVDDAEVVRANTVTTTELPSVVTVDDVDSQTPVTVAPSSSPLSTGLVIQIIVATTILFGATIFFLRRRRRRRDHELHKQKYENAFEIRDISTPNGLGGSSPSTGGDGVLTPPAYPEALKTPVFYSSSKSGDVAVMDECMRAVYDAENAFASVPPPPPPSSPPVTSNVRHSISRWLHSAGQRLMPGSGSGSGPLTSNPPRTPRTAKLFSAGVPPTPGTASAPQTPWSATHLVPYPEPMRSAVSTSTRGRITSSTSSSYGGGDDDRLSIRASIPNSVLYPSPLQPAPPPRRLGGAQREPQQQQQQQQQQNRDSADLGGRLRLCPSDTWRTMTPHEDPPGYEPRRGNPEGVSPVTPV